MRRGRRCEVDGTVLGEAPVIPGLILYVRCGGVWCGVVLRVSRLYAWYGGILIYMWSAEVLS